MTTPTPAAATFRDQPASPMVSDDYRAIAADEATFTDVARSEYWTGLNYSVINRLLPELTTSY